VVENGRAWPPSASPPGGSAFGPASCHHSSQAQALEPSRWSQQRRRPPKQTPTTRAHERPSNQVSNNRHRQQWTPADADGRSFPGQACRSAGSLHHDLASGRRGQARPSCRACRVCGVPLPNWAIFGSRLARSAQPTWQADRRAVRPLVPRPVPARSSQAPRQCTARTCERRASTASVFGVTR
jgi:hypothetical protein